MNRLFLLSAILVFIFASCGTEERKRKASATGRTGELLVVMDKNHWEGRAGDMVKNTFGAYQEMLPQPETKFDVRHIDKANFTSLFETHRNLLMVEIDPTLEKARLESRSNIWSRPQRVVRIYAPNDSLLEVTLERNARQLIDLYLENERERLISAYRLMSNPQVRNAIEERFNVKLLVPEGYFIAIEEENFAWLRRTGTKEDLDMGLLLTILPYTDPDVDFDYDVIWSRRDSITKRHIAGQLPNSYMTTYEDIPPNYREINFKGRYAVELRGLWKMEGDFMGGPFVNYTMVDETTGRLINIDVFVWAPPFDKRDYLRQLEALAYTLEFPGEQDLEEEEQEEFDLAEE